MILVIAGISGDLARRKLIPALQNLKSRGQMPFERVIGTTRRDIEVDGVDVRRMDIGSADDCKALARDIGTAPHIFYLSVPPGTAPQIAQALAAAGFGDSKLILEKPFGFDGASSSREARDIAAHFPDSQVLRVDHYLCKNLARDIAHRGKGAREIKIFASESDDVSGRKDFYEKTGALRDFGNHLLTLANRAVGGKLECIGAKRAQYEGYEGTVETFFELTLRSGETNITLASGKALAKKYTHVVVDSEVFMDEPDRAYEEVLLAAAQGDKEKFLSMSEVGESWRIMDAAREMWRNARTYKKGVSLESVLDIVKS